MENVTEFFTSPLAKSLGWTLVHALWQILVITLVYFVVVLSTKKANIRYWSGMGLLAIQFAASVFTFFYIHFQIATQKTLESLSLMPKTLSGFQTFLAFLQNNLSLLVGVWMLGCVILFAKTYMKSAKKFAILLG